MGMLAIRRVKAPDGWRWWPLARRHEFVAVLARGIMLPIRGLRDYQCQHCQEYSGLSEWGLMNLSFSRSRCSSKKAPRIKFLEWLRNSVDCSYTRTIRELK